MIAEEVSFLENTAVGVRALKVKDYPPHWHDRIVEIIFVLRGTATIITSFECFSVPEKAFVLINEGEIHHIHCDEDCEILSLYLNLSSFKPYFKYIEYLYFSWETFNPNPYQKKHEIELKNKIFKLFLFFSRKNFEDKEAIQKASLEIINLLVYNFDIIHYYSQKPTAKDQLEKYHSMIKYIEENYASKIRMEILAKEEFFSKNYVSQFWKNMTTMNFTEFLNSRRVEMAEKLMFTDPKASMEEISVTCGFSDTKYFYRSFKKWYRSTPNEHKKKLLRYLHKTPPAYEELTVYDFNDLQEAAFLTNNLNHSVHIFLPIHKHISFAEDGSFSFDAHILKLLSASIQSEHTLCFELDFQLKTPEEWVKILKWFEKHVAEKCAAQYRNYEYWVLYSDSALLAECASFIPMLDSFLNPETVRISARL